MFILLILKELEKKNLKINGKKPTANGVFKFVGRGSSSFLAASTLRDPVGGTNAVDARNKNRFLVPLFAKSENGTVRHYWKVYGKLNKIALPQN